MAGRRFQGRTRLLSGVGETVGDFRNRGERLVGHERGHGAGMGLSVRRMDTSSESWRQVHFPALGCDEEIPVRVLVGGCSVLVRAEHEFVGWRGHFRCGLFWVVEERVGSALFLVEVEGIPGVLGLLWCCGPRAGGGNRSRLVVSAENPSHPERDDRDQDDERNDQAPR